MNIGVITTSYPRWPGDAAGNFVGAHVESLRALGHTVEVVAAAADEPLFYRGGAPDALESGGHWFAAAKFTAQLARRVITRARDWDLAIAHWLVPSAIAALPTRVPLLAIGHGGDVYTLRRLHLLLPTMMALLARNAKVAFVSEHLRVLAVAPHAIVQPMGIDVAHFSSLPRTPTDYALVLARLVPIKGVDIAIAAARASNSRLIIAGDGPERASLERAARGLPIEFVGEVDAQRRDQLLQRARVVWIPSRILANGRTEGSPVVAFEALAAGVPVIASRVGGLADLPITLVPPDDPVALARAIPAAPPTDVSSYDWRNITNRLLAHAPV
ncbi:MAG TPA: glycosyltransferase family 4 protein [Kofleriaceae bacterium]